VVPEIKVYLINRQEAVRFKGNKKLLPAESRLSIKITEIQKLPAA